MFGLEYLAAAMGLPEIWLQNFVGLFFLFGVVVLMAKFEAPTFSITMVATVVVFLNVYIFLWPLVTVMVAAALILVTFISFARRGEGGEF